MFSNNENLIKINDSWISANITKMHDHQKVTLITTKIIDSIDTNILISYVKDKLSNKEVPEIHIYLKNSLFYYDFPICDIFKINDKLIIEFWITSKDIDTKNDLEKPNNIDDWSIIVCHNSSQIGRNIYATDLTYNKF